MPSPAPAGLTGLSRQRLVQYFFFGVFLLLLHQLLRMLAPFYVALLCSAVLAFMAYPLHERVLRLLGSYPSFAAAVTTALAVVIVVVPMTLFTWVFVKDASKLYPTARVWMQQLQVSQEDTLELPLPPSLAEPFNRVKAELRPWNIDLQEMLLRSLDHFSAAMTHLASYLIKHAFFLIFNLLLLGFTLFFFLRDGALMIHHTMELVPMPADHKRAILARLRETLDGVIFGAIMVGAVQGVVTGIGFWLFGVPFPILLSFLIFALSFIPFGGFAVLIPAIGGLTLSGATERAVYLTLWCTVLVGLIDHILRPLVIGNRTGIPLLLLFFALLGGVHVYGMIGILLGPLVIALTLAFINIYRQEYRWLLQLPDTDRR